MSSAENIAGCVYEKRVAPLVACGCAARADGTWRREIGGATTAFFDLASLTKPMTAVAVARAGLPRSSALGDLLIEARNTPSEELPLELFLAHRAGLLANAPLFEPLVRGEAVDVTRALRVAAESRREDAAGAPPSEGFAPLYSDLGYILAGAALARHAGVRDAGDAITRLVIKPLGVRGELGTARQLEASGVDLARVAAPTEHVPWRGGTIVGRVHDENAWALTGDGGSGHAGVFGTIEGVLAFGCAVLDAMDGLASPLAGARLDWLVRERSGGTLRAGFDGKTGGGMPSMAGSLLGARSFGHLGFTGTSIWIDPDAKVVVSLLTNRVHPSRESIAIRAARPEAHDALFERALELR